MIVSCVHISFLLLPVIINYLGKMDIKIALFNMRGFKNGSVMPKHLCNDLDVIFVQEHWLLPANLNLSSNFCDDFTGA